MDVAKNFAAGTTGGVLNVVLGHPFDTIKVRLQAMPTPKEGQKPMFKGPLDCLYKSIRIEGPMAIFKGMGSPLIYQTPIMSVFFAGAAIGRRLQGKRPEDKLNFKENFINGCIAGTLALTVRIPGERIKSLLQIQEMGGKMPVKYTGPIEVVTTLYRKDGIRSLYKGATITAMRDIHASGIYVAAYEHLKTVFSSHKDPKNNQLSIPATIFAGGIAGMCFWAVNIPFDVIKSRLQTYPSKRYPDGMKSVFQEIIRQEGIKGFFKGTIPAMLRAFPANAGTFLGYEMTKSIFKVME